jgi:hypothetical protein
MQGVESLADLEWEGQPERHSLRRAVRHRLRRFDPTIRVVAEGFLAEGTAIDLLAVGGEGELISIRLGLGQEDDALLFTWVLADLTWLRPRAMDLLKLAPGLGLEPSAEPRAMLFCPRFSPQTVAAAENFPSRSIELLTYHCLRQQGQLSVLIESWSSRPAKVHSRHESDGTGVAPTGSREWNTRGRIAPRRPLSPAPSPSSFRTGLKDSDLRMDEEEIKILD